MAITICTVSGNVSSLLGQGLNSVTIKAYMPRPFKYPDGTLILNYEVSTSSDVSGDWSLALAETETAQLNGIPITIAFEYSSGGAGDYLRREYTCVIPNTPTATFASLIGVY